MRARDPTSDIVSIILIINKIMTHILNPGEKVHIIHRRRFEKDIRRHFIGHVDDYEHGVARVSGYVFVIDDLSQHLFVRRPDKRIKLVPLTSGEIIVNVIPSSVDIETVHYELKDRTLIVTDGSPWTMDVKEFGWG